MDQIIEDNKLIVEFMGCRILSYPPSKWTSITRHSELWCRGDALSPFYHYTGRSSVAQIRLKSLKYHESWDWLMTVVDKIDSLGFPVMIYHDQCVIKSICTVHLSKRINSVYKAVVEFIKWYNSQE
jgi:hypothetical protein